jgi:hypothetical protein
VLRSGKQAAYGSGPMLSTAPEPAAGMLQRSNSPEPIRSGATLTSCYICDFSVQRSFMAITVR